MERTAVCQFEVLRKRCDRIDNSITLVSIRQDWEHGLVRESVHNKTRHRLAVPVCRASGPRSRRCYSAVMEKQLKKPRAQDDPETDPQLKRLKEYRFRNRLHQAVGLARARLDRREALTKCVAEQSDTAYLA